MFRYIDDVLSLNNSKFGNFVDRIYPIEHEVKDTTDTDRSASYLDIYLAIDCEGRLRTTLYDESDDFNFPIKLSIYMKQHSCSTCIWRIYLSVDAIIPELVVPIWISLLEGCC